MLLSGYVVAQGGAQMLKAQQQTTPASTVLLAFPLLILPLLEGVGIKLLDGF